MMAPMKTVMTLPKLDKKEAEREKEARKGFVKDDDVDESCPLPPELVFPLPRGEPDAADHGEAGRPREIPQ